MLRIEEAADKQKGALLHRRGCPGIPPIRVVGVLPKGCCESRIAETAHLSDERFNRACLKVKSGMLVIHEIRRGRPVRDWPRVGVINQESHSFN